MTDRESSVDHSVQEEYGPEEESLSLREVIAERQAELDYAMVVLSDEISMWNLLLADMSEGNESSKGAKLGDIAQQAIESLDSKWHFFGDNIHVSGEWYVPSLELGAHTLSFEMEHKEAFSIVESNGFAVMEPADHPPMVGMSFKVSELPIMSAAVQGKLAILTFADPSEVSLCYVKPHQSEGVFTTDLASFTNSILYFDKILDLHYNNIYSEFYKKSAQQQKKYIQGVVDRVSDALPSPTSGTAICDEVTIPYVYRRVETQFGQRMWQKIAASDGELMLLSGNIDGIGVLELPELDTNKPIRNKKELIDPEAGLCLVLQVEQANVPDIFNDLPIYVPLRLATQVSISLP